MLALQQQHRLTHGLVGESPQARVRLREAISSSAAVGIVYLLALQHVNQIAITPEQNIALVQQIENQYLGLRIGILDQAAILLSRERSLTEIDCAKSRIGFINALVRWGNSRF